MAAGGSVAADEIGGEFDYLSHGVRLHDFSTPGT
jgi:hypothetical protein